MRLAALAAAALLTPTVAAAPPQPPQVVAISVGHDRAKGFVAGDGLVVTVAHVLEDRGPVLVDGRRASVVRVDRAGDLALLRVTEADGEAPRLGGDNGTRLLDRPAPVVRRVRASVDGGPRRPVLVVRARTARGDSGTPLITESGRVAGVLFARSRMRASTAYAVDAAAVGELLARHSSP
jgi:S1-C subfamily serine protease